VFVIFLDFNKAFDKVSYWKLFPKLLDDKVDINIVRLLSYWYSRQQACIRWHGCQSQFFTLGNGARQEGVLFFLFICTLYKRSIVRGCFNKGWLQSHTF